MKLDAAFFGVLDEAYSDSKPTVTASRIDCVGLKTLLV